MTDKEILKRVLKAHNNTFDGHPEYQLSLDDLEIYNRDLNCIFKERPYHLNNGQFDIRNGTESFYFISDKKYRHIYLLTITRFKWGNHRNIIDISNITYK
jgi:hypothetical protein